MKKLRVLDLFSGIGGFSLGLERTGGFETVAFCEIEEGPRRVLQTRWPGVPIYHDIRKVTAHTLAKDGINPNCIAGGFPCQDISIAGKGAGASGPQSGLWREYIRLVREVRPEIAVLENVTALLGRGFGDILRALAEIGYDAEWDCLPATFVGAPHNRDRLWVIAYPQRNEQSRKKSCSGALRRVGRFQQYLPWDEHWEDALARIRRMDDGLPRSVDRTDSLRNTVVPQIPEMIGYAILEAEAAE